MLKGHCIGVVEDVFVYLERAVAPLAIRFRWSIALYST